MHSIAFFAALVLVVTGASRPASAQSNCGSLQNHFGPFDYRIERDKAFRLKSTTSTRMWKRFGAARVAPTSPVILSTSCEYFRTIIEA